MVELVVWLRAQLDEDERIARAATAGPWTQSGIGEYGWGVSFSVPGAGVEADDSDQGRADADHIAEHDPARVLREIDAKRLAIDHYQRIFQHAVDGADSYVRIAAALSRQIQIMASVYADRPGYRQSWRP
ncbi:DUF6221 family protein [Streptomyces sp. LKA04]|uniref:DUF6221 family protein n=1 Tax=Streptomyces sp. LKA04 TaxID=3398092 RepID=UPI003A7FEEF1